MQVIQIFFEMFVCGRRKVLKQLYFEVTSIRENLQKDSYEFNELLHEVVSKELCISQKNYIDDTGEIEMCTALEYITK